MKQVLLFIISILISFAGYSQVPSVGQKSGSKYSIEGVKGWYEPDSGLIVPGTNAKKSAAGIQFNKPGRLWFDKIGDSSYHGWDGVTEFKILSEKDTALIRSLASGGVGITYYAGGWMGLSGYYFFFDTSHLDYDLTMPDNFHVPTSAAVNGVLNDVYTAIDDAVLDRVKYGDSVTKYVTPYDNDTAKAAIRDSLAAVSGRIPDISGYVPYTGATANVNLGAYDLTTSRVNSDTIQANSSMGIHMHGTSGLGIMVGAGGGGNITFDSYPTIVAGDSVLTTNSSGALSCK
jgi:hypothetical protein